MAVTVKLDKQPERRIVPIDGLDGCTLTVREPTRAELFNQWIQSRSDTPGDRATDQGKLFDYRLRVIVDWAGFVDTKGGVLQFNPVTFDAALRQCEPLLFAASRAVRDAFEGLPEQDEKNSDTPPSVSSLDAATDSKIGG